VTSAAPAAPASIPDSALTPEVGSPYPLGATPDAGGVNVALYSEVADFVEVCLFDAAGNETRVRLPEETAHVHHGYLPDLGPGLRYGFRVHGPWDPANGVRCNPAKLLLDPHATAIEGQFGTGEEVFGHHFDNPEARNDADSAPSMPRCVVTDRSFDWGDDAPPRIPMADTIVYETHVKGLTMRHPGVPEEIRGTYAALGHPAITGYLAELGVTAIELLPVHQFVQDSHLVEQGLRNYWGYNSIGFLAPHNSYAAAGDDGGQVREFKEMVKALHAAGLEVILDVVYNHTAEGNHLGPTFSLRGIDNAAYYRLVDSQQRSYYDTTGTGNSLNVAHPAPLQLVMDSLRYWVTEMHVDGFRFDLATTLTRQSGDMDRHSAFLDLVHQDPVLAGTKMIAEPWDTAGYQVGGFPARWSEWNGKFRDTVRDFWRGEEGSLGEFGLRLTGSPDIYAGDGRAPTASVNFVTAHDGFTLADLTAYNDKHNEANGEGNNDGESNNSSWNCGVEGDTDDPEILALRARQRRNMLATLLLSAGTPMLLGGDELGRTQRGNNNGYCQDNEIGWYDWENADADLLAFTRTAIALRREHGALRPRHYLRGPEGGRPQLLLFRPDGEQMTEDDWSNPISKTLAVLLDGEQIPDPDADVAPEEAGAAGGRFLMLINSHFEPVDFVVPKTFRGGYRVRLTTDDETLGDETVRRGGDVITIRDRSLTLLVQGA
jgi:glycogen operon protein